METARAREKAAAVIEAAFKEHSTVQKEEGGYIPIIAHEADDCAVCAALMDYYEEIA